MKSDAQIRRDVVEELDWEPAVNALHVDVDVNDGVVTLAGHVNTYAEKLHAAHAARRVEGVRALTVDIVVHLPGQSRRSDANIARSVHHVLEWTVYLPVNIVQVGVENGWVTLTGQVEWDYQRRIATDAIRFLMGVTGVSDQITIRPSVALGAIQSVIEAALKRRSSLHGETISVKVQQGDVTLAGSVRSRADRPMAGESAWGTPGVHTVVDRIAVLR